MDINVEKGLCLVIFFLITLVPGATTVMLFSRCQKKLTSRAGRAVMALLKCFAGGVFLSTCLLGLVAEGLEEYEDFKALAGFTNVYPFFHLGIAGGFFLVAYMERLAFCVSGNHGEAEEAVPRDIKMESFRNKAMENETPKKEEAESVGNAVNGECVQVDYVISENEAAQCAEVPRVVAVQRRHSTSSSVSADSSRGSSGIRAIIVLLALSFHTLFDGLVVGLQDTDSDIWAMTIAITIHKTIMVNSLALELCMTMPGKTLKVLLLLLLFALMTPIGVAIGMGVTSGNVNLRLQLLVGSILQAVAAGSVLYVTFFEILSEELGHHSNVLKVTVTVVGFAAIAVAKIWDTD